MGKLVKEALERDKTWEIYWFQDGRQAYGAFKSVNPDLCILDVMLPEIDGFELARMIREHQKEVPILFLTARSQTADIVKGFESGGNDYLRKPFSLEELTLRIKELLKRYGGSRPVDTDQIRIGNYQFQPAMQMLKTGGQTINLSFKETELLRELVKNKNGLMDRKETLIKLWGDDNFFNARNMDVYIGKLRKHLAGDPNLSIVNIRGYGYKLIEQTDA